MRHPSFRAMIGLAGSVVCALSYAGQAPDPVYSYYKEKRPLILNRNVVAIYKAPEQGKPNLDASMLQDKVLHAGPLPGWWLLEMDGGGTRAQVRALAARTDGTVTPVFFDGNGKHLLFQPSVVVQFNDGVNEDIAQQVLASMPGAKFKKEFIPGQYRVTLTAVDGYDAIDAANRLADNPYVKFAVPPATFSGKRNFTPNDPYFEHQWALSSAVPNPTGWGTRLSMRVARAWDVVTATNSVAILILEDGIELEHPDLPIANGKGFLPHNEMGVITYGVGEPLTRFDNHGTPIAGIIGATIDNGRGIAGVAGGASLFSARVHASDAGLGLTTQDTAISQALTWGHANGARISNNSNSYGFVSPVIEQAYLFTKLSGMTHFCASGNSGATSVEYPGDLETVNAVTGILPSGAHAGGSTGEDVDFSAPGYYNIGTDRLTLPVGFQGTFGEILSGDGNYVLFPSTFHGTSFASAYVAGVAALLQTQHPDWLPAQIELALQQTALDLVEPPGVTPDRVGWDDRWGWGLVDAFAAVSTEILDSIVATPNPVKGGLNVNIRLNLLGPAPNDQLYKLRSGNNFVIPIDENNPNNHTILIPRDQDTGARTFTTRGVDAATPVKVYVDFINLRREVTVNVIPATLNALTLNRSSVYGGESLLGTVILAGRAGPSGATVAVTDNSAAVNDVGTATIPAQADRVNFPITTNRTATTSNVTVTATYRGFSLSRTLQVRAVLTDVLSLTLARNVIMGGERVEATVRLTQPAPAGGATINLADNNTATSFFPTLNIPAGATEGTFLVYTGPVGTQTFATINATYFGKGKSTNLTLTPTLWATSLTVTPSVVRGGFNAIGRVEIYSPAPAGGVVVTLNKTNSYCTVPATVTIPQGMRWAEFTIRTFVPGANPIIEGTIRATAGGVTKVAPITVYR
ncbi:MAG: S8 family serine peptidase [Methanoregulaceae archaeon]|nr:S8 family serine peptidase [Methanoregulaceae archaeon]